VVVAAAAAAAVAAAVCHHHDHLICNMSYRNSHIETWISY